MAKLTQVLEDTILFEHDSFYADIRELLPRDLSKRLPEVSANVGKVTVEVALGFLKELAEIDDEKLESHRRRQVESVRHQILSRIVDSLPEDTSARTRRKKEKPTPQKKSFLASFAYFWFFVVGGSVLAICNGITGVTSILSWFSLSQQSELIAVAIFSGFSMFTYFANDLKDLGIVLEIPFRHVKSWLNSILEQQKLVLEGYNRINVILRESQSKDEKISENANVREFYDAFHALEKRLKEKESKMSKAHIRGYLHKGISYALLSLSAIVYSSGGYFVGRQAAVVILKYIPYAAISSVSFPLILSLSGICSIVSLTLFYWKDFPNIISYINLLSGIPDDLSKEFVSKIQETDAARRRLEATQQNDWFSPHKNKLSSRIQERDKDIKDSQKRIISLLKRSPLTNSLVTQYDIKYGTFKQYDIAFDDLDKLQDTQESLYSWLRDVETIFMKDYKLQRRCADMQGALSSSIDRSHTEEETLHLQSLQSRLKDLHTEYQTLIDTAKAKIDTLDSRQAAEMVRSQQRFKVFLTHVHHHLFFSKPIQLEQFADLDRVPVVGPDEPDLSSNDSSFLSSILSY